MAPLSESNMQSEIDKLVSKIGDDFTKIKLEEQSTYNIDDEDDSTDTATTSNNLDDCAIIKEKGLMGGEKINNNRLAPYGQNTANKRQVRYNNINNNNYIPNQNQLYHVNNENLPVQQQSLFNHVKADVFNNIITSLSTLENYNLPYDQNYDNNYIVNQNIPAPVVGLNLPLIQVNIAQKALSNYIDQHMESKQSIWILVNIEDERRLITKLKNKISSPSGCFDHKELIYIYAIIIRLMKEDGKQLLLNYLQSDDDILRKIVLKQNVLLMNFWLEIYHNLAINTNQDIIHHIINLKHIDLSDILKSLINYKSDYDFMFDVNYVNNSGETLLMVLLKILAANDRNYEITLRNMNYLDLILSRRPRINYLSNDGKNIFHYANEWKCNEYIIEKIKSYYDELFINSLLIQPDFNGFKPCDYKYNHF